MGKTKGRFIKKHSKKQKLYKMKGCSKTRKHYLGGSTLAYTGQPIFSVPNPHLAYTGKGGSSTTVRAYPATDPVYKGEPSNIFASPQLSGGRNLKGGMCQTCPLGHMIGGTTSNDKHRNGCRCSDCKQQEMKGGNAGIPYPNGLVGSSWKSDIRSWPGVNGIPGDSNHYPVNHYNNDVSRQMKDVGANAPFSGGRRRGRKQKGGTLSNFMGQDLINLGRQFQFGVGSAYNALAGYSAPVNPLPWKDQFPSKIPFNPATV